MTDKCLIKIEIEDSGNSHLREFDVQVVSVKIAKKCFKKINETPEKIFSYFNGDTDRAVKYKYIKFQIIDGYDPIDAFRELKRHIGELNSFKLFALFYEEIYNDQTAPDDFDDFDDFDD